MELKHSAASESTRLFSFRLVEGIVGILWNAIGNFGCCWLKLLDVIAVFSFSILIMPGIQQT